MIDLGKCLDAFEIAQRGLVLAYSLYTQSPISHGQKVTGWLRRDGQDIRPIQCEFGYVLGGKKARYDMTPFCLMIVGTCTKAEVIGSHVLLDCPYEFWQPPSE